MVDESEDDGTWSDLDEDDACSFESCDPYESDHLGDFTEIECGCLDDDDYVGDIFGCGCTENEPTSATPPSWWCPGFGEMHWPCIELNPMGQGSQAEGSTAPTPDGMQPVPDITVDTGAGASAANKKTFGGCTLEESPGSKAGQYFIGANGGRMANLGQVRPRLMMENGFLGQFTFQAADGIRESGPLLSVSEVNSKGNPGWFDGEDSFILPDSAPELAALREIVQKI